MSSQIVAPQASGGISSNGTSSTGIGVNSTGSWDPKVTGELLAGDSVSGEPAASGSGYSTGDEGGKSAGGDVSSQRQQQQQEGGIISRVKGMQDRAGRTQVPYGMSAMRKRDQS